MSFLLPPSCIPYRIVELFACAKYHEGREVWYDNGYEYGQPESFKCILKKVELSTTCGSYSGIDLYIETLDGSRFISYAMGSLSKAASSFFRVDEITIQLALTPLVTALREGDLNVSVIDSEGNITQIPRTFHWLDEDVAVRIRHRHGWPDFHTSAGPIDRFIKAFKRLKDVICELDALQGATMSRCPPDTGAEPHLRTQVNSAARLKLSLEHTKPAAFEIAAQPEPGTRLSEEPAICSEVFVSRDEFEAFYSGTKWRRNPKETSSVLSWLRNDPRSALDSLDRITEEKTLSAGDDGVTASSRHSKPRGSARLQAQRVLNELFPEEVPGPDVLSNAALDKKVNDEIKAKGLYAISKRTILRAAGRERA